LERVCLAEDAFGQLRGRERGVGERFEGAAEDDLVGWTWAGDDVAGFWGGGVDDLRGVGVRGE
jgi:hypothetical protein